MTPRIALAFRAAGKAEPYERALAMAGLEAVPFTPESPGALEGVQGLVLTGGSDVDPALYLAPPHREAGPFDRARDDYEASLLRQAFACDLPVLAICRGMQLLNVARGGTLIQHLPNAEKHRQRTGGVPVHEVELLPALASLFGESQIRVNSRHHQAVDQLGEGLTIAARDAEDGVIEGAVLPGAAFVVAVQWHPEEMTDDPAQTRLFAAFRAAVGRISG